MSGDAGSFERGIEGLSGVTRVHDAPGYEHTRTFQGEFHEEGRSRPVTLRALPAEVTASALGEEFFAVARSWRKVATHPNVVEILEWGEEPDPWVVVDDVPGDTLAAVGGELSGGDVIDIVHDVAEALRNAALYNVSHLNLHPAYVRFSAEEDAVAVDDWGLERTIGTYTADDFCTPYTAPEQLEGSSQTASERTDVYGLAGLTYVALTGSPPATASQHSIRHETPVPPSEFVDEVPAAVDSLLERAFDTDPAARPDSPFAFATQLRRALEPAGDVPTGGSPPESRAASAAGSTASRQHSEGAARPTDANAPTSTKSGPLSTVRRRKLLKAGGGIGALGVLGVAASQLLGDGSSPDSVLRSVPDLSDFVTHVDARDLLSDATFERAVSRTLSRQIETLDATTATGVLTGLLPGFDLPVDAVEDVIVFGASTNSPDRYVASILRTSWSSRAVRDQLTRLDASVTEAEYRDHPIYVTQSSRLPWTVLVGDLGDGTVVVGTRPEIEDVVDVVEGVSEPVDGSARQAFESAERGAVRFGFDPPASFLDPGVFDVPGARLLEDVEYGYGSASVASDRSVTLVIRASSSSAADDIESQLSALVVLVQDRVDSTPVVDADEELSDELEQLLEATTVGRNGRSVSVTVPDGVGLLSTVLSLLFRVDRLGY